MHPLAFLTLDNQDGWVIDDALAIEPLQKLGYTVQFVPWRAQIDWGQFDAVIIRSPWDYQHHPETFLTVLETITRTTRLANPLELVTWNLRKTYLRELATHKVPAIPTAWGQSLTQPGVADLLRDLNTDPIILKPLISASAENTHLLYRDGRGWDDALKTFHKREFLAQPFIENILSEGEFSLFFFGGVYSHAILKTPKSGDFRVQEEYGGLIQAIEPEPELLAVAQKALSTLDSTPLYARTDFIRLPEGGFAVMEFELIEPSLYFRTHPAAPENFARAVDHWMKT